MHNKFAYIYDEFTKGVDYREWFRFIKRYAKVKDTMLDIGCGTGVMANMFFKYGYKVVGMDISKDMLEVAHSKYPKLKLIEGDITKDYLNEKFKYIMCNFDTVNYIKDFESFVSNCSKMQDKGSLLIFDLVTEGIFEEIFAGDSTYLDEEDTYKALWKYTKLSNNEHKIDIDVEFDGDKFTETHIKYIHEMDDVVEILTKYGYKIYDTAKNEEYGESRLFIIAKK